MSRKGALATVTRGIRWWAFGLSICSFVYSLTRQNRGRLAAVAEPWHPCSVARSSSLLSTAGVASSAGAANGGQKVDGGVEKKVRGMICGFVAAAAKTIVVTPLLLAKCRRNFCRSYTTVAERPFTRALTRPGADQQCSRRLHTPYTHCGTRCRPQGRKILQDALRRGCATNVRYVMQLFAGERGVTPRGTRERMKAKF